MCVLVCTPDVFYFGGVYKIGPGYWFTRGDFSKYIGS